MCKECQVDVTHERSVKPEQYYLMLPVLSVNLHFQLTTRSRETTGAHAQFHEQT